MSLGIFDLIAVSVTALFTALFFWAMKGLFLKHRTRPASQFANSANQITFLIEGDELIDCSPEGAQLLSVTANESHPIAGLEAAFPDLGETLAQVPLEAQTLESQQSSDMWLEITPKGSRVHLAVCGLAFDPRVHLNSVKVSAENAELEGLRELTKNAPQLMWRTNANGQLIWANDAYLTACDASDDLSVNIPKLPSKALFKDLEEYVKTGQITTRCSVKMRDEDDENWFDILAIKSESGTQHFATNANSIVRAEQDQRKFVQTLSQTFAQLSIGLAIFDRRRQLATFNPALLDMTTLPFEFLSGRPSIDAMLDALRELRMLPEPKDYPSWREQFSEMERAAKDGTYSENWNLPDGQTFRVTGRPHLDGAIALLFEDISAEISLTRRFRSEIETSQAVIDSLDEAIVVFSNGGNLVLANNAYCQLWNTDLDQGLNRYDLRVEVRKWQSRCTPTRIWTNLKEFTSQMGMRQSWTDTAVLDDGRQITCVASPIKGGMTMIRFHFGGLKTPHQQKFAPEVMPQIALKR